MRTQLAVAALAAAAITVSSCASPAATSPAHQAADQHSGATALDWDGRYAGVVPCADCEGIETSITLNKNLSYRLTTRYRGKDDRVFERQGAFTWEENGNVVHLAGISDGPSRYRVGEDRLIQLDREGRKITGTSAGRYILSKVPDGDAGAPNALVSPSRWVLTELMGKQVDQDLDAARLPWLKFEREGGRVSGFSGCNRFSGSVEVAAEDRIRFSRMAMTRMACPDMGGETDLLKVLETADSYRLEDQGLVLYQDHRTPLARFRAAAEKQQ
jgi:heat shock protein HslJ/uncharacterized lipoprotein NlpE involved in copper resistance